MLVGEYPGQDRLGPYWVGRAVDASKVDPVRGPAVLWEHLYLLPDPVDVEDGLPHWAVPSQDYGFQNVLQHSPLEDPTDIYSYWCSSCCLVP